MRLSHDIRRSGMETETGHPATQDRIETRAYELFLARGCEDGHDLEDWLRAESELVASGPQYGGEVPAPADSAEPASEESDLL
jgi:hypothetical protein